MRVLVAEDDAKLREVLARGLRSAGYTVDVAARGDAALDMLLLNRYAAAVVDWRMPVMDGIDVVSTIRSRNLSTRCSCSPRATHRRTAFVGSTPGATTTWSTV